MILNRIKCAASINASGQIIIGDAMVGFLAPVNCWHTGTPVDGVAYTPTTYPYLLEGAGGTWELGYIQVAPGGLGSRTPTRPNTAGFASNTGGLTFSIVATAESAWACGPLGYWNNPPSAGYTSMAAGLDARVEPEVSSAIAIGDGAKVGLGMEERGANGGICIGGGGNAQAVGGVVLGRNGFVGGVNGVALGASTRSELQDEVCLGQYKHVFYLGWEAGDTPSITARPFTAPNGVVGSQLPLDLALRGDYNFWRCTGTIQIRNGSGSADFKVVAVDYGVNVANGVAEMVYSTFTPLFTGGSAPAITPSVDAQGILVAASDALNAFGEAVAIIEVVRFNDIPVNQPPEL